ncbi:MAG: hypothetical protein UU77_C0012G0011 [candidate division WWE3 bacterium GW2011_GWC1_41_7]|uniref:Uncharacterized protein n=3 Tax=Katanobacteria TaxID=422282 RepID=A0A0G0X969_UNCKA|nr:MAG: hypothetical protein UU72_C0034G0006 [candidate division WWE3 bacterium GW2011_GWB1_41_6]KKS20927.1 MAG: hypothetical protein UU77_C0012G0011 [candidate division WWE3 bacterium GW2011_GWC1_41_7]KKS21909.1 MAG: hypothetical protein UU80_C0017G0010 [candidate division WWE3 bacterium GW2011_GWA1_41_8]
MPIVQPQPVSLGNMTLPQAIAVAEILAVTNQEKAKVKAAKDANNPNEKIRLWEELEAMASGELLEFVQRYEIERPVTDLAAIVANVVGNAPAVDPVTPTEPTSVANLAQPQAPVRPVRLQLTEQQALALGARKVQRLFTEEWVVDTNNPAVVAELARLGRHPA